AGFGLVFLGIGVLGSGMEAAAAAVDPARFALPGLGGRLLLVVVGAVSTVLLQSSSAAVATTLAAVDAGTVGFDQAAALVVGQNVGTTVTAGIGAIGGGPEARRIALGHVLFNLVTGLLALLILPPAVGTV